MTQTDLLEILQDICGSDVHFEPGEVYHWSPHDKTVYYQADDSTEEGLWTLIHEASHELLGHATYKTDFELVGLEVAAWERAQALVDEINEINRGDLGSGSLDLGKATEDGGSVQASAVWDEKREPQASRTRQYGERGSQIFAQNAPSEAIRIQEDHVQDCLDSYRDWQYKRSLCPTCNLGGVQTDERTYKCPFCNGTWHVSSERFCRPYRRRQAL